MLLRIFKGTGPDVIMFILIITALLWTGSFIHPTASSLSGYNTEPMPLFGLLLKVTGKIPLINVISAFLMVLFISVLLVNFNTSGFFISERTFLPALFYVFFSGFFPGQQSLNPVLPAAIFLILAIRKIMDSYKIQYTAYSFFDAGLLISTGSLFYAGFVWFGLLLMIGILILRTGNIREIIISLLGLITPWFIAFGLYYVSGRDPGTLLSSLTYNLFSRPAQVNLSGIAIAVVVITGIILLISIVFLLSVINTKKIKSRKTFRLFIWAFLITGVIFFFIRPGSIELFWLAGVPASYFLSHYFVFSNRKMINGILFSAFFILAAMIQILDKV